MNMRRAAEYKNTSHLIFILLFYDFFVVLCNKHLEHRQKNAAQAVGGR